MTMTPLETSCKVSSPVFRAFVVCSSVLLCLHGCGWLSFDVDVDIIVLSVIFILCVLNPCSGSLGGVGRHISPHSLIRALGAFSVLSSGLNRDWSGWNNLNLTL